MASDTIKRIDRLLTRAERHIAAVFSAAIEEMRNSLDLDMLADLFEAQRWDAAFEIIEREAARIAAGSNLMFVRAGQDTAEFLATAKIGRIAFDQVNQRAVLQMQSNRLNLIRQFADGQRDVLREVMRGGIARGLNPIDQAREFREVVGLTDRQARAVINFRRLLGQAGREEFGAAQREALTRRLRDKRFDRSILAAIRDEQPLDPAHIDRMVDRYRQRYVKHRAENIARTEALRSVHQGTNEAWQQAIDLGQISEDEIEQTWRSARDGRVRDSHQRLNGEVRKIGETWQGDHGALRYPGDPAAPAAETINCRCIVVRRSTRLAGARNSI